MVFGILPISAFLTKVPTNEARQKSVDSGKGGLYAGNNFFDDIGRFFSGDREGEGDTSSSNSGSPTSSNDDPNVLFEIPGKFMVENLLLKYLQD